MTTKEVAQICGVTEKTVYNNANKANVVLEHGKAKDWTEEELKRLQLVLMKNQISQGTETNGGAVEYNLNTGVQVGLTFQEIVNSGNVEAMKELTTFAMNACAEVARNKQWKVLSRVALLFKNSYVLVMLKLYTLVMRFKRQGIEHPTLEAKKYLIETI